MGTNTRVRKYSLDHYSNKLLLDRNGNTHTFQRLASLSEDDNETDVNRNKNTSVDSDVTSEETWKKLFMNQIQNLLKDINVSQTLSERVYDEIMNKTMNNNMTHRNRRSSCFTLTGHVNPNPKRRTSVTSKNIPGMFENRGRRMSHAGMTSSLQPTSGRRSSVAHLPSYGRRLSCANNNYLPNQPNFLRQRRKSSAKPVTLTVVKVSSVQKQLHNIYKRRRRKDRASVNIDDVKSALRGPDYKKDSESEPEADKSDSENVEDENSNSEVWEDVREDASSTNIEAEPNCNDNQDTVDGEPTPVPRRKDSTQIRAWELSRRLRSRRRGRRQVSADF